MVKCLLGHGAHNKPSKLRIVSIQQSSKVFIYDSPILENLLPLSHYLQTPQKNDQRKATKLP
jgi:hypothetical protein